MLHLSSDKRNVVFPLDCMPPTGLSFRRHGCPPLLPTDYLPPTGRGTLFRDRVSLRSSRVDSTPPCLRPPLSSSSIEVVVFVWEPTWVLWLVAVGLYRVAGVSVLSLDFLSTPSTPRSCVLSCNDLSSEMSLSRPPSYEIALLCVYTDGS